MQRQRVRHYCHFRKRERFFHDGIFLSVLLSDVPCRLHWRIAICIQLIKSLSVSSRLPAQCKLSPEYVLSMRNWANGVRNAFKNVVNCFACL